MSGMVGVRTEVGKGVGGRLYVDKVRNVLRLPAVFAPVENLTRVTHSHGRLPSCGLAPQNGVQDYGPGNDAL